MKSHLLKIRTLRKEKQAAIRLLLAEIDALDSEEDVILSTVISAEPMGRNIT
ncbi:MAG: hypothetical protein LBT46_15555 [Planctomycetaceae bacterium]|jgi:hypothetical protein|nr:hypothetical protein [Planctomycetaceae bacterium]